MRKIFFALTGLLILFTSCLTPRQHDAVDTVQGDYFEITNLKEIFTDEGVSLYRANVTLYDQDGESGESFVAYCPNAPMEGKSYAFLEASVNLGGRNLRITEFIAVRPFGADAPSGNPLPLRKLNR